MSFAPKRPILAKKRRAQALSKSENKVALERVLGLTCVSSNSLALSNNSQCIVYTAGCTVVLFYPKKNKQDHIINPSRKPISCVCIGSDKYLAYGEYGHSPSIRVWDISVTPPTEISKLNGHAFGVSCLAFSPNLRYLVSVGYQHDQNIFVWSWKSSIKLATNKITTKVNGISFSEDGKYFVTAGNRRVRYWYFDTTAKDIRSKATLPLNGRSAILGGQQSTKFVAVACGRGSFSKYIYAVSANGLLYQFNEDREIDKMLDVQSGSGCCISITESHLLVGCVEGIIRVFDPISLDYVISLPRPHSLGVNLSSASTLSSCDKGKHPDTVAMAYSYVSSKLAVIYNDHSLYTWDIKNLSQIGKTYSCLFHNACVWDLNVYGTGIPQDKAVLPMNSLISCSSDNTIRFWSLDSSGTGELCFKNIYSKELIRVIYDTEDVGCLRDTSKSLGDSSAVSDVTRGTRCVELHPLGHQMATGDRKGNLKIYDLDFMDKLHDIMAHDAEILTIKYSSLRENGTVWLATGSRDRLIHLFNVAMGYTHTHTISDHSAAITSVKFIINSDNLLLLVSSGADKSLMTQELREGGTPPIGGLEKDSHLRGTTIKRVNHVVEKSTVYDMVVDPLLKTITTVGQDRTIRIYHASSCKQKQAYKGGSSDEGSGLLKVAIDPSGVFIATSGSDKIVCLFEFATGECIAKLHGHSEVITALKFSGCCRYLYTASGDSCIFVWKLSSDMTQRMHDRLVDTGLAADIQPIERFRKRTFCISSSTTARSMESQTSSTCNQKGEGILSSMDKEGRESTDSMHQDVFDEGETFKFQLDQLPVWAQNQVITRPSIAQTVGIDLEQDKITVTESSHANHVTGKWAERANETIQVLSKTTESLSDTFDEEDPADQSVVNFEAAKIQLKDLPLNVEEDDEEVQEADEEVVYPVKEKDSVDPSIFKVSTPEKKPSLDNKENVPQLVVNDDTQCEEEEEEEEDEGIDTSPPSSNHQEAFLKANFESLTADELFQRRELLEELVQLSPRRPSISTLYLKKARSRIIQGGGTDSASSTRPCVSPLSINVTTPSYLRTLSDASNTGQPDELDSVVETTPLTTPTSNTDEVVSKVQSDIEPVDVVDTPSINDLTNNETSSCDNHMDGSKEIQSRPRPISDNKSGKVKITVEEISKARRRLEELGYSDEYVHGNKNKKKDEELISTNTESHELDHVDYEEVKIEIASPCEEKGTQETITEEVFNCSEEHSVMGSVCTMAADLNNLIATVNQMSSPLTDSFLTECNSVVRTMKQSIADLEMAIQDKAQSSSQCTAQEGEPDYELSPTYAYLSSNQDSLEKISDPLMKHSHDSTAPDPFLTTPDPSSEDPINSNPVQCHAASEIMVVGTRDIGVQVMLPDPTEIQPLLERYSQQIVEAVKLKLSSLN